MAVLDKSAVLLVTTVLFLGVLAMIGERKEKSHYWSVVPLLVVLLTGAALIYSTLDMPHFGDPDAPIHHHVAPRYMVDSLHEVGPPNMVTSVLASYRGYDTLGEVTVIFTAAVAIILLLGTGRGRWLTEKVESLSVTYSTSSLDHEEPSTRHPPEP